MPEDKELFKHIVFEQATVYSRHGAPGEVIEVEEIDKTYKTMLIAVGSKLSGALPCSTKRRRQLLRIVRNNPKKSLVFLVYMESGGVYLQAGGSGPYKIDCAGITSIRGIFLTMERNGKIKVVLRLWPEKSTATVDRSIELKGQFKIGEEGISVTFGCDDDANIEQGDATVIFNDASILLVTPDAKEDAPQQTEEPETTEGEETPFDDDDGSVFVDTSMLLKSIKDYIDDAVGSLDVVCFTPLAEIADAFDKRLKRIEDLLEQAVEKQNRAMQVVESLIGGESGGGSNEELRDSDGVVGGIESDSPSGD